MLHCNIVTVVNVSFHKNQLRISQVAFPKLLSFELHSNKYILVDHADHVIALLGTLLRIQLD